ncbi:hypothetical protein BpHYR1_041620 [Brachionus plicatilis]|uniref:Uncharacterized protein n=1 Tax=Brachionus plicatilis TaxID=10195 RepID=A0A3M7RGT8_BRAPC|nr:hypothetical protein BpHYR1_041620 [Brachionus plicatilis]
MFSGLLSLAGLKGALAGGILQTGLDIGQQISGNQLRFQNTNIPPNIDSQVKDFKENTQKKLDAKKFDEDKAKKWRKRLNSLPPINSFILRGVDLINGFKNKLEIFQSLENSIDAIYEIFRQIETFRQQIELGRYIERVTNKGKEFQIPEKYQSEINSMKTVLIENFIREAVKKSFQAFSFWPFPFYCDYLKNKTNNAELIQNDTNERMLIYEETINNIRSIVNDHEININFKIDNYLINFNFENESSLFKWSSRDFPFEVEQLFLGNFSTFYSNVKNSSYNAVKVSQIRISIECQSRKINQIFDEILRKFAVNMIHNGESNYRLLDKFYKFSSLTREQLELQYSYGCHLHSKCNLENDSFRKLSNSKRPSISPYTFWRIKLVPKDKNPLKVNEQLHRLNSIFKEIDEPIIISLNGYGQYVNDEFNKHSNVNNCEELNAIE